MPLLVEDAIGVGVTRLVLSPAALRPDPAEPPRRGAMTWYQLRNGTGGDVSDPHQFEPHQFDHSVRDGIFDGSADDIQDLGGGDSDGFYHDFSRSRRRSGYRDLSRAPSWVKLFVWAGALLAIAGIGVVMFGVLSPSEAHEPFSTRLTPTFPTVALPPGFPTGELPVDLQPPAARDFPGQPPTPSSVGGPNLPLGFGLFFAGFVLTAIGSLGHSTSRRR